MTASHLDNHPYVSRAHLDGKNQNVEIELNHAAHEKLKTTSRAELNDEIIEVIAREFDSNHTITFILPADCALDFVKGREWPELLSIHRSESNVELNIWVQQELSWFEGHFPGHPVLAGVVQTHWAATIAQYLFHISTEFQAIENLKFQRIIEPQTQLLLSLEFSSEKQRVLFRYSAKDDDYSKGRIRFAT